MDTKDRLIQAEIDGIYFDEAGHIDEIMASLTEEAKREIFEKCETFSTFIFPDQEVSP